MKEGSEPWKGKWALITGASSGIGKALAEELAAGGAHLVLTARRTERLVELAANWQGRYGTRVQVIQADLNDRQAPEHIFAFTRANNLTIDVLINNAGLLACGEFHASELEAQLSMVQVHCSAVLHLTHLFVKGMVERRCGHVLVVATTTLAPAPYLSVYAATKGFDLLFAEGLAEEVARHSVHVSVLCPGPTESELTSTLSDESESHSLQSAQDVARKGLRGLARGKRCIRPSPAAWLMANVPRLLPRGTVSGALEPAYRPKQL